MTLSARLRKLTLTTHLASSLGWLGAVAAFLALAVSGLTSGDPQIVRAAYLANELITWWVIVPLAFASLLTGIAISLGTTWGLFRHYWVLVSFLLTLLAVVGLMIHTQPIGQVAVEAAVTPLSSGDLRSTRIQLVVASGLGLLVLAGITVLNVYKPQGMTRYGRRKRREERLVRAP